MATYADQADFEAYVEGWATDYPVALERILERASRDVDRVLGPLIPNAVTGFKLDPTELADVDREALARATCAQAYWRIRRGEGLGPETAPRGATKAIKGPDFEVTYADTGTPADRVVASDLALSPDVARELEPLRYLRARGARARA